MREDRAGPRPARKALSIPHPITHGPRRDLDPVAGMAVRPQRVIAAVEAIRHELLHGAYLGDPDAALLLGYTYEAPPQGNPLVANLKPPLGDEKMPDPVVDLLKESLNPAAPIVFDGGTQRYLLGVLYYRVRFLRESPTSILVPGEWLTFSSPRALLLLEALNRHDRLDRGDRR